MSYSPGNQIHRDLGRIDATLEAYKNDQHRIQGEVNDIKASIVRIEGFINELKGGHRLLFGMIGAASTLGGIVASVFAWKMS